MNPIREPANASRMLAPLLPGLRTSCMGSRGGAAPMPANPGPGPGVVSVGLFARRGADVVIVGGDPPRVL